MSVAETSPSPTRSFDSRDPVTGDLLATYPVGSAEDVAAAVRTARGAAGWWGGLDHRERARSLGAWRAQLARRAPELARLVQRETGKPFGDAMLEVAFAVEHVAWAARHAGRVLGRRRVRATPLVLSHVATVEYQPLGVVGVIGPWNYPVLTPMGSLAYALAAGNTVVYKPSELAPGVGAWLADACRQAAPDQPILQVVTGDGQTGAALCRSGVDKIAFTGSTATGRQVLAACADTLTPVTLECGGKDALLVDADADVGAAAEAAVWGAMSNGGQTCIGVERAYVHQRVYEPFLDRVTALARAVQVGTGAGDAYGPATLPTQLDVFRAHVADALARGGRVLVGGAVRGPYAEPTVLVDVPEDALAVSEETFGPTLTVAPVRDMAEAVARANASRYGLGAAVFSRRRGPQIARQLRCGSVSVNAVLSVHGIPALPFGGVGESGFGRIHGADGLREFARAKSVARQRFPLPVPVTSFRRTARTEALLARVTALRHGRG